MGPVGTSAKDALRTKPAGYSSVEVRSHSARTRNKAQSESCRNAQSGDTGEAQAWREVGASGVSDIFHGNVGQGLSKIYEAERPHVIQGSYLEKAIQKIDPSF